MKKNKNLIATKKFYDPHPGFGGAAIPMPRAVKIVADGLNGKSLPLQEAMQIIRKISGGKVRIVEMDINFILLEIKAFDGCRHAWRVICYR